MNMSLDTHFLKQREGRTQRLVLAQPEAVHLAVGCRIGVDLGPARRGVRPGLAARMATATSKEGRGEGFVGQLGDYLSGLKGTELGTKTQQTGPHSELGGPGRPLLGHRSNLEVPFPAGDFSGDPQALPGSDGCGWQPASIPSRRRWEGEDGPPGLVTLVRRG